MIKFYPSLIIYVFIICLSIRIIIRRRNFLFTWIGFELSIFGFLPLFAIRTSTTDAIIKYFLIQARGSVIYLISFLTIQLYMSYLVTLGISIKLGIFPFFQWIPIIISSLSWYGCILLTTIQKLGPLFTLLLLFRLDFLIIFRLIGIFLRRILGFNQSFIRPLIAYSSISHTSWIILTIPYNNNIFYIYLFTYILLTFFIFSFFKKNNTEKIRNNNLKKKTITSQYFLLLILTGIPPFSFFFFKIRIIYIYMYFPLIIVILLLSIYIRTYYYLSFIIPNLINKNIIKDKSLLILISINLIPFLFLI